MPTIMSHRRFITPRKSIRVKKHYRRPAAIKRVEVVSPGAVSTIVKLSPIKYRVYIRRRKL